MATQEYKFVPEKGVARITSDLNVRSGAPASQGVGVAKILHANISQSYIGYVLNGEEVAGNAKWFLTADGDFFWSGNTDIHNVAVSGKILNKPLDELVCTQRFGERPEFYSSLGSSKGHNGMDFRTRSQNNLNDWKRPVYAVLHGTISEATENQWNGKFIRIAHDNGYESVYLHLSAIEVTKGQKIAVGGKIGMSGNSGAASEAPHLHFGYRSQKFNKDNGYMGYIDPTPYFKDEIKFV
ncbi:MAG: M23 family metallopeptidase [bacterium]|nr:M23 family metallopeptidase [bacterium]